MSYIKFGSIVFSLFVVTAFVWASESDELRGKAEAMQREAAELVERGHREEAANLKRKAMELLEEAERLQVHRLDHRKVEVMKMKRLLDKLRQKEKQLEEEAGAGESDPPAKSGNRAVFPARHN